MYCLLNWWSDQYTSFRDNQWRKFCKRLSQTSSTCTRRGSELWTFAISYEARTSQQTTGGKSLYCLVTFMTYYLYQIASILSHLEANMLSTIYIDLFTYFWLVYVTGHKLQRDYARSHWAYIVKTVRVKN